MSSTHSLYITLQYLRTVDGVHKYHWALYVTGSSPPNGHLLHATDVNRQPLDLYVELRAVRDPKRSKTMVVCLKIADSPGMDALKYAASAVPLMDKRYLPPGEPQWTCRVWLKEVLYTLEKKHYIQMPWSVDKVEERCLYMADANIGYMGSAKVYNDLAWLSGGARKPSAMDIDAYDAYGQYYGPKPMDTEISYQSQLPDERYYGPKPMVTETYGGYYGSKPMVTETYYASPKY